jgi:type IV secretion system protein VirB8
MKKQTREALDAYYMESDSWGHDRREAMVASRRTAWWVAAAATIVAVLLAIAIVVMMPLKTVEPLTLLVDKQTGFVQALTPLDADRVSGDRALTQSFLVQYVIARESYDADSLQANYRKVALWSAERARAEYLAFIPVSNPDSPMNRMPRSSVIETQVKSVSPVGTNVAMVRFETRRRDAGGLPGPPSAWVAMVRYRYSGEPMSLEDRFVNPLGFEVVRYRRDAEAIIPAEPVATPVQAVPVPVTIPAAPPRTPVPDPDRPVRQEPNL